MRPSNLVLQAYFQGLRFDTSEGAQDMQRLLRWYPDSLRYGPLASIQPEVGNYQNRPEAMEEGRVLARIINHDSSSYPKLGLRPHSITYWWVKLDYRHKAGSAYFVSTDPRTGVILARTPVTVRFTPHADYRYRQPVARWLWRERDEMPWAPCPGGCCRSPAE
jgi:hypothetical protein